MALVLKGDLGLGEAFMAGQIDFARGGRVPPAEAGDDLDDMKEAALAFFRAAVDPATSKLYSWWLVPAAHVYVAWALFADMVTNLQSVTRSRAAIASHYDKCTKTIEVMTAPSFVYTCAHWGAGAANVTEAQRAKMNLVCEKLLLSRKG